MRTPRKIINKKYEERHKEERKAKYAVFGTSMPRKDLEDLNAFLVENGFSKKQLIYEGWEVLKARVQQPKN